MNLNDYDKFWDKYQRLTESKIVKNISYERRQVMGVDMGRFLVVKFYDYNELEIEILNELNYNEIIKEIGEYIEIENIKIVENLKDNLEKWKNFVKELK
ncbi:MAG: hypothetical protein ACYTBJ_22135 [Planctomycetota bacterium]|jgi:hypothetical protein